MPTAHEIDYRIFGDDMQFVEVELDPREAAVADDLPGGFKSIYGVLKAMEEAGMDEDSIEDFMGGYDFHEAFILPFRPSTPPRCNSSRQTSSK